TSIRAAAAQPKEIGLALKEGVHQFVGGQRGGVHAQHGRYLGADRNRFGGTGKDAAAPGNLAAVIVLPARARQREKALAFAEAERRIGIRVDEDRAVVEVSPRPGVPA